MYCIFIPLTPLPSCLLLQTNTEPENFTLHPQPLEYNYDEFQRLLLGIGYHVYVTKQKNVKDTPFEEFLGETLDVIFKKAGVLVDMQKEKAGGQD